MKQYILEVESRLRLQHHATKDQVVKKGLEINVPYKYTWSCYEGGEKPCGKCGTCIDRAKAFELNGIKDPAME